MVAPAVVLAARRTPFGVPHGALSGWHPADLLAHVLTAALDDAAVAPDTVDHLLVGCAAPVGAQADNVGRAAAVAAGWGDVPATVVTRGAGSSHRALHLAAHTVAAGAAEIVVVGGVEVMSLVPAGAPAVHRPYGRPWGGAAADRYADVGGLVPASVAGDRLAEAHRYERVELDRLAADSRSAAGAAHPWLVPTEVRVDDRDQVRPVHDLLRVDELSLVDAAPTDAPAFHDGGVVAATNQASPADGAAAVVVASTDAADRLGRPALATIRATAEAATDAVTMFGAGSIAVERALDGAGLDAVTATVFEVDTAHAAAERALRDGLGSEAAVNPTGGALGRGRPLGAVGAAAVTEALGVISGAAARPAIAVVVDESDDGSACATVLDGGTAG